MAEAMAMQDGWILKQSKGFAAGMMCVPCATGYGLCLECAVGNPFPKTPSDSSETMRVSRSIFSWSLPCFTETNRDEEVVASAS
jgi:hypothetical protein